MGSIITTLPTTHSLVVASHESNSRLDSFVTKHLPEYSRSFIQKLIEQHNVMVNGKPVKQSTVIKPADEVVIHIPAEQPPYILNPTDEEKKMLEALSVSIIHADTNFYVLEKPADLLVHRPSSTTKALTLVDWLLYQNNEVVNVGHPERPGIVHRLDKDTSGLIIIARNNYAHTILADLFKNRKIKKTYLAIVQGHPEPTGTIDLPIGRDPFTRNQMTIHSIEPRESKTHYKVIHYFDNAALVEVTPVTGRTHQIRVHFKALGHPLLGDELYGKKSPFIKRQALHAAQLSFDFNGKFFHFESPMPSAFKELIEKLN